MNNLQTDGRIGNVFTSMSIEVPAELVLLGPMVASGMYSLQSPFLQKHPFLAITRVFIAQILPPPMNLQRYTPNAVTARIGAETEAYSLKHSSIGPEHLLLGLLRFENPASIAIRNCGLELDSARTTVRSLNRQEFRTTFPIPNSEYNSVLVRANEIHSKNGGFYIHTYELGRALTEVSGKHRLVLELNNVNTSSLSAELDRLYNQAPKRAS